MRSGKKQNPEKSQNRFQLYFLVENKCNFLGGGGVWRLKITGRTIYLRINLRQNSKQNTRNTVSNLFIVAETFRGKVMKLKQQT